MAFMTALLLLNIVVSVAIIGINKHIYVHFGFPNITLTCIHFLITFVGLVLCQIFGLFRFKRLSIFKLMPLAASFCGFVVLTNLSLQFNTVGTYQLAKTLTTPCIMLIQSLYYSMHFTWSIRLTCVPVFLGVLVNSYYDVAFSPIGIAFATVGVLVTSLYQVLVGAKQEELAADSMQLLLYQAPLSAALLMPVIVIFEPPWGSNGLMHAILSREALQWVFCSGLVALLVNLSIYFIIGNTSAVTYNMAGHLKFGSALLMGWLLFKDHISQQQAFGMFLTFGGVAIYSVLKMSESRRSTTLPTVLDVKK